MHHEHASSNAPPEPTGELLVALPRRGPNGGEQELRLVLDEYKGHPYIAVRLWQRDVHGGWRPSKDQGCSIRLGEANDAAMALTLAVAIVDERREIERSHPSRPRIDPTQAALPDDKRVATLADLRRWFEQRQGATVPSGGSVVGNDRA